jgi:hypothetical protein
MKLELKPTSLSFTGTSDTKKTTYHVDLEFFEEIDVNESKTNHTARDIELVLRKKEKKADYWPRLLKDKAKVHFLKTDFDKVGHYYIRLKYDSLANLCSGSTPMSKTRQQMMTT